MAVPWAESSTSWVRNPQKSSLNSLPTVDSSHLSILFQTVDIPHPSIHPSIHPSQEEAADEVRLHDLRLERLALKALLDRYRERPPKVDAGLQPSAESIGGVVAVACRCRLESLPGPLSISISNSTECRHV